jgi:hypothetical protein
MGNLSLGDKHKPVAVAVDGHLLVFIYLRVLDVFLWDRKVEPSMSLLSDSVTSN